MLAAIPSAIVRGVQGHAVTVEVHVGPGLPGLAIVGLPDAACREARDRVRAAVLATEAAWPTKRITVNLAPSGLPKVGSGLDVAMAVGVLVASEQVPLAAVSDLGFVGELGLDGTIRPVPGIVPLVDATATGAVVVPERCAADAALVPGTLIRTATTLAQLVAVLKGRADWPALPPAPPRLSGADEPDLAEVRGQPVARRALEVAAAGGHHLLLTGPPGAGKTMVAKRLPGLLPDLDRQQAMEASRIASAAGEVLEGGLIRRPPFRAPHHRSTSASLIGGGSEAMRPGELSRASGGVLFLDELAEFSPSVLDALRQPLEEGVIRVSRSRFSVLLPAQVLLVAAMNPCPCGEGRPGACSCSEGARARYQRRVSGPLLDRFDLRVDVRRPAVEALLGGDPGEPSAQVAHRVAQARRCAEQRGVRCNADLPGPRLDAVAPLTREARAWLAGVLRTGRLSARGLDRVRRVARTLADLDGDEGPIDQARIATALALRADLPGEAR